MTSCFLAFLKVAEGQPHLALPFIQEKLGATLLAGYTGANAHRGLLYVLRPCAFEKIPTSGAPRRPQTGAAFQLQANTSPLFSLQPPTPPSNTFTPGSTAVWPAVNIITFRYVPQDLRILFCSIVGLFWVSVWPRLGPRGAAWEHL